jgi:DNA-binding transcriptional MerR regulator
VEYIRACWWGAAEAALFQRRRDTVQRISDDVLDRIEREHAQGITSAEILDIFASHGVKFSEATLRKYVQLGLLPRSVRVGRKGKHQGSQGMYPAAVVRQIQRIKEMMAQDYTIEEIQREFLFVRGDIEELERTLSKIFETLKDAAKERRSETSGRAINNDLVTAESLARELVAKLSMIEERLMAQARLSKQAASG